MGCMDTRFRQAQDRLYQSQGSGAKRLSPSWPFLPITRCSHALEFNADSHRASAVLAADHHSLHGTLCQRKLPRLTTATLDALIVIQPALSEFRLVTNLFSEVEVNAHRILPAFHRLINSLRKLGQDTSSQYMQAACNAGVNKLLPYMWDYMHNKWVCAAFALNPRVREAGSQRLLQDQSSGYAGQPRLDVEDRMNEVILFMKSRVDALPRAHADAHPPEEPSAEHQQNIGDGLDAAFAEYPEATSALDLSLSQPWDLFNLASDMSLAANRGEKILHYWKRQEKRPELVGLVFLAREVLGLAPSSASVERLFSAAGFMLNRRRYVLSSDTLALQTALKIWMDQGISPSRSES